MQNLLSAWTGLPLRRQIMAIVAAIIMLVAIFGISRAATTPGMALLYAGLEGATAGTIVEVLEQRGVQYDVRGDSIYVPNPLRDELRMTLAMQGLPTAGGTGYELLDGLSGFGTTAQMFDAAYWRAKEGELARTILATPHIRAARVHIAQAPKQAFQPDTKPTASVTVTTAAGSLSAAQAKALKHLVAAAVAGLSPEDVTIIDSVGGLITTGEGETENGANARDRAAQIQANVERLLAARVGMGKAVVEVNVDLNTEREAITERRFDPKERVAISLETEERSDSASQPSGDVTVASNLPEGDSAAGGNGQSQSSQTKERTNFEVSETQREVLRVPGAVKRMSVAVLVDGLQVTAADGTVTWQPRPEEELAVLRELVSSAVGIDEARGDVLTLRSLEFQAPAPEGTLVEAGLLSTLGPIDIMSVIQIAVLAIVALVLGLFVIRPIVKASINPVALPNPPRPLALPAAGQDQPRVLTGEIEDQRTDIRGQKAGIFQDDSSEKTEEPMARLKRLIDERQAESVEILRGWMEQDEGARDGTEA